MPTFTAITLDRLLEPSTSSSTKTKSVPPPPLPLRSCLSLGKKTEMEKKKVFYAKPQASPLLYTTPEATPLPDDGPPVSFAPSPFIVDHKRRGPRLLKSFSQGDVCANVVEVVEVEKKEKVDGEEKEKEKEEEEGENGKVVELNGEEAQEVVGGDGDGEEEVEVDDSSMSLSVAVSSERDYVGEDFFDPQDSLSVSSSVGMEDNYGLKITTPEFFDASEELSSDGSAQSSLRNIESELREMRLNLLMEIERRRQAEESLDVMKRQWQRLREQLSLVGLTLPPASIFEMEGEKLGVDPAEELCRQIDLARAISTSIGRGCAKAEAEMEMESQIESKNFEIARLCDRLHYYEAMNHEMSQRNQEATETARRNRQKRKRRQGWIWGSIGASIVVGSAVLAWSYLPSGSAPADSSSHTPGGDDAAEP